MQRATCLRLPFAPTFGLTFGTSPPWAFVSFDSLNVSSASAATAAMRASRCAAVSDVTLFEPAV
jgi:hypothetical protein